MPDTRLVPMTREQRDALEAAWPAIFASTQVRGMQLVALKRILDDWDAAPADATEAIRLALAPLHDLALVPANGSALVRAASTSVAIALGMPDA